MTPLASPRNHSRRPHHAAVRSTPVSAPTVTLSVVRIHKPHEAPHVEVLVDGTWYLGSPGHRVERRSVPRVQPLGRDEGVCRELANALCVLDVVDDFFTRAPPMEAKNTFHFLPSVTTFADLLPEL
jgi:hypothetical protein